MIATLAIVIFQEKKKEEHKKVWSQTREIDSARELPFYSVLRAIALVGWAKGKASPM